MKNFNSEKFSITSFLISYGLLLVYFIYKNFIATDTLTSLKLKFKTNIHQEQPGYIRSEMVTSLKHFAQIMRMNNEKDGNAIDFYELALDVATKVSQNTTTDEEIPNLYSLIGLINIIRDQPLKALKYYRKLLAWNRKLYGNDYNRPVAEAINMIGICYERINGYADKATKYFKRFGEIRIKIKWLD